jgi:TRAP-type mannitol/chloroaromatic compound transport system permease small subunit
MQRLLDQIDLINKCVYIGVSFLFVPMTLAAMLEVVMRYAFNQSTMWAWDINVQLFCAIVVLGGAHTLQQHGHVVMDIFINKCQQKTRLIINLCVYIVFFFAMILAMWQVANFAWQSLRIFEKASTVFSPPIYPIKILILIGVCLLVLQAVSGFIKDWKSLRILLKDGGKS